MSRNGDTARDVARVSPRVRTGQTAERVGDPPAGEAPQRVRLWVARRANRSVPGSLVTPPSHDHAGAVGSG